MIFMLLSPIRNSVLEELRVRRLAVIYRKRYGVKRFFINEQYSGNLMDEMPERVLCHA